MLNLTCIFKKRKLKTKGWQVWLVCLFAKMNVLTFLRKPVLVQVQWKFVKTFLHHDNRRHDHACFLAPSFQHDHERQNYCASLFMDKNIYMYRLSTFVSTFSFLNQKKTSILRLIRFHQGQSPIQYFSQGNQKQVPCTFTLCTLGLEIKHARLSSPAWHLPIGKWKTCITRNEVQ